MTFMPTNTWTAFNRFWGEDLHLSVSGSPEEAYAAADWVDGFSETLTDSNARKALSRLSRFLRKAHTTKVGVFRRGLLSQREREERLDRLAVRVSRIVRKAR